jgi:SlyX protein
MTDPIESRLMEVESRLAHQERLAEELSSVMAEQARTIDILTRQARQLTERLEDIEADWKQPPAHERPPHY